MDVAGYIGLSGKIAALNELKVTNNNLANSATNAFKGDAPLFDKQLHQDKYSDDSFPVDFETFINFEQGEIKHTGNNLDAAILGKGFFMIQTNEGDIAYSRNGKFSLNSEGVLVDIHNGSVLSADGDVIEFEPGGSVLIKENGEIIVNNASLGQLGIATFEDLKLLKKTGLGYFKSIEEPETTSPEDSDSRIIQGALEASNISPVNSMLALTEINNIVSGNNHFIKMNSEAVSRMYKAFSKD